ncbi:MAG: GNAT family N-acetyltransferase [Eubacterium sp.]|nr:GNAT family N-acetyltransferase [Eubacterium sp.]MBQ8981838.1 GNAT family N-acetyltransferase [Eubacterium sp.]MBR1531529.1 GNAT family N-acetyltransferase [Eubacterium sp.]
MELRPISKEYTEILSDKYNMSLEDINKLITQSDSELFENKFFKMYVIMVAELIVGTISVYEHSANVVSIGPDIFEEYRQRGYATEAMKAIMDIAKAKGYKVVFQQIRTNNTASIALHTKLGFETDNCIFKNKNDNEVSIYLKPV